MDTARLFNTARHTRLAIFSRKNGDVQAERENAEKFERMASLLGRGGITAKHFAVQTPAALGEALERFSPDMAFCSFFKFEAAGEATYHLRPLLMDKGIAWVGSSTASLEMALSKSRTKAMWREQGIPTPDWFTVSIDEGGQLHGLERIEELDDFPYIVKPDLEGNSRGIDSKSVVNSPLELFSRATMVADEFKDVIVERFVSGGDSSREFTAALIGNGRSAIVSAVEIRKIDPAALVVSQRDKDDRGTIAVSIEDTRLKRKVEGLARMAFRSLGMRDYSRCDILLHGGSLFAIEVNGQPMVPDRWFEACAREAGLSEEQYLNAIILSSIAWNAENGNAFISVPLEMRAILQPEILGRLTKGILEKEEQ